MILSPMPMRTAPPTRSIQGPSDWPARPPMRRPTKAERDDAKVMVLGWFDGREDLKQAAATVAARYGDKPPAECLRFGVACGAESVQRLGAGLVDPQKVDRLVGEVDVQRIEAPAAVS